jgi:hypothetical protein
MQFGFVAVVKPTPNVCVAPPPGGVKTAESDCVDDEIYAGARLVAAVFARAGIVTRSVADVCPTEFGGEDVRGMLGERGRITVFGNDDRLRARGIGSR